MSNRALVVITIAVSLAACTSKKKDTPSEPAAEPAAEPAKPTPAEGTPIDVNAIWDAWSAASNARDGAALKEMYAADATVVPASSGMTMTGPDQIAGFFTQFGESFPDIQSEELVRLVNGATIASIARTRGTHTKPMMGMAATNKKTSFTGLSIVEIDNTGKIKKQTLYADNLSFMAQLGAWDGAHRAYDASDAPALRRATTGGSKAEADNVRLVGAMFAAFNAHDTAALAAAYAPDALIANQAAPADATGADAAAAYKRLFAGFSDAKKTDHAMWSAGDWVVSTYVLTATNDGPVERLGVTKPTGKTIRVEGADVLRIQDGNVAEHWIFADGMAVAMPLGVLSF